MLLCCFSISSAISREDMVTGASAPTEDGTSAEKMFCWVMVTSQKWPDDWQSSNEPQCAPLPAIGPRLKTTETGFEAGPHNCDTRILQHNRPMLAAYCKTFALRPICAQFDMGIHISQSNQQLGHGS